VRFKIDENLPQEVSEILRSAQHDAMTVVEQRLSGEPDFKVANICRNEKRALVTLDLDFADIRSYPPADSPGIVVIRPKTQDKRSILKVIDGLIPLLAKEPLDGRLWVADETAVRIRGDQGQVEDVP
jgi:predicted nuclease of predicted toxin-antitoxin system